MIENYLTTRQAMHQATNALNELHRQAALSKDIENVKAREKHLEDAVDWHKLALATMRQEIEAQLLADLQAEEATKESQRQELERDMNTEAGIAGAELAAALESLDQVGDPFCSSFASMIRDSYGKASRAYPGPTATAFSDALLSYQASVEVPLFQRLAALKPAADLEQAARIQFDRMAGE